MYTSRPAYRMTGLEAHVVHLYPRWVLSRGNGTLICILRQPLSIFAPFLAMILIYCKGFKTLKFTRFGALAGHIRLMAAQKVGFTLRPNRYGPPILQVSSSAALHIRAELETCQLGEPYLGACKKRTIFWPQITPPCIYTVLANP